MLDRSARVAEARFDAGGVVVALPRFGMAADRLLHQLAPALDLALLRVGVRGEDVFPRRRLEHDARLRADGEDERVVLGRDRAAPRARAHEDERSLPRVYFLVVERERRAPTQDDIHLLMAVGLGVLFEHALPRLLRAVGIGAEGADSEAAPDGPPDELASVHRHHVELVDVRDLVSAQLVLLSASSTTGSIVSAPSTRIS